MSPPKPPSSRRRVSVTEDADAAPSSTPTSTADASPVARPSLPPPLPQAAAKPQLPRTSAPSPARREAPIPRDSDLADLEVMAAMAPPGASRPPPEPDPAAPGNDRGEEQAPDSMLTDLRSMISLHEIPEAEQAVREARASGRPPRPSRGDLFADGGPDDVTNLSGGLFDARGPLVSLPDPAGPTAPTESLPSATAPPPSTKSAFIMAQALSHPPRRSVGRKDAGKNRAWLTVAGLILCGAGAFALTRNATNGAAESGETLVAAISAPAETAVATSSQDHAPIAPESVQTAMAHVAPADEPPSTSRARTSGAPRATSAATSSPPSTSKPAAAPSPEPTTPPVASATATPPAPAEGAAFDRSAASAELARAASTASGCHAEGDPRGVARVSVTFSPSGRVTSATVNGPPFAGTQTGGCVAKAMRSAIVPAFSGTPITVTKSVTIH